MPQAVCVASALAERCLGEITRVTDALAASLHLAVTMPGPRNPHLLAAYDAAATLGRQLDLLRAVWTGASRPLRVSRMQELLRGAGGWERTQLDLSSLSARATLPQPGARVIIGCVLLALDALPNGGIIRLARTGRGEFELAISGPGADWPPELPAILTREDAASMGLKTPQTRLAALLAIFAHDLGVPLTLGAPPQDGPPPLRIGRPAG